MKKIKFCMKCGDKYSITAYGKNGHKEINGSPTRGHAKDIRDSYYKKLGWVYKITILRINTVFSDAWYCDNIDYIMYR